MTPKEVITKAIAFCTSHDREGWMSMCTPDVDADRSPGPEAWGAAYDAVLGAFPDGRFDVTAMAEGDPYVACEVTFTATHDGAFRYKGMEFPATGKRVRVESCWFAGVAGDKVASLHSYGFTFGLMRELEMPAAGKPIEGVATNTTA